MVVLAALSPLLAGCDQPTEAAAGTQPSLPDVSIVTVKPQPRAMVRELPGRIAPTRVSEVRPRVSGIVVERMFRQGSEVKAGDPLYRIDPRPFEVEVQSSKAALAMAEAVHVQAAQQARRIGLLTSQRAAPEVENEKAIAAERQAAADVEGRKADLARANLNLDYATIRAPIDGIVGAAQVSEGALVVQHDTTALATIQQLDPIYADFTQSVGEMTRLRRAFESGDLERIAPDAIKVRLVLDDAAFTRSRAGCCSPKPRSMPTPDRSRCVASSPIPGANCCRACMSASGSSRASTAMRSRCRSRRSSATLAAAARSSSSRATTASRRSRSAPARSRTASGW